jgi:adenylate cyclase
MKKINYFIIPIIIFVILQLVFVSNYWHGLELKAKDMLFQIRGEKETSGNIVIVNIGDDTFNSLGIQWPFPREYHAQIIDNLERAGAAKIIFDIEFVEESNAKSDSILAYTIAKYNNITLAGKVITQINENTIKVQVLTPISSLLRAKANWGTVNISADNDGFVREYELFQKIREIKKYSLGAIAIASFKNSGNYLENIIDGKKYLQISDYLIPKMKEKTTLLNYYGPAGTFPYYEFADVLDSKDFDIPFLDLDSFDDLMQKGVFKDKIVIVGVSAVEFHDSHPTPFFSVNRGLTPGIEIHATFIDNVLMRNHLSEYPYLTLFLVFLLLTFILFFININIRPTISIIYNSLLFILYFVVVFYFFSEKNMLLPVLEIPAIIVLVYIIGLVFQYIKSTKEKFFIKKAFGRYIAPSLVEELVKDPKKLEYGGSLKNISVLFSDIVSFTSYTETHTPKETVEMLREYLTAMVEIIKDNKGTLDKFVGDEIVALFGAPVELENHAYWAAKAALEMRYKMKDLQEKWEKNNRDPFEIGIGINSGEVTVGNLGSEQIFDYTAIGDNMNAGARIEALTRNYKTENNILISESTKILIDEQFETEYIDDAMVKGKSIAIKVYQLLAMKTPNHEKVIEKK